jgi:D-psicose/D-tagatose/L-ribulose 3-epimerase
MSAYTETLGTPDHSIYPKNRGDYRRDGGITINAVPVTRRGALVSLTSAAIAAAARKGPIELGVCEPAANFEDAVRLGFDYYEPEASEIAAMDQAAYESFQSRVLSSPIRCKAFRSFIRSHKLVGEAVPLESLRTYVAQTTARCAALGARVIVFGSGGARQIPDGFSRTRAWDQLCTFLRMAGDAARRHGITIGIEPLRRQESNVVNSVGEALHLARDTHHPSVRIIVDFYHLRQENESPDVLWEARPQIVHLHFANPAGRVWPKRPDEDPEYRHFFRVLKEIEYRGGLTIEAPNGVMRKDAPESLRFFEEMLGA